MIPRILTMIPVRSLWGHSYIPTWMVRIPLIGLLRVSTWDLPLSPSKSSKSKSHDNQRGILKLLFLWEILQHCFSWDLSNIPQLITALQVGHPPTEVHQNGDRIDQKFGGRLLVYHMTPYCSRGQITFHNNYANHCANCGSIHLLQLARPLWKAWNGPPFS